MLRADPPARSGRQAEVARQAQTIAAVVRDARARLLADDVVTLRTALDGFARSESERHGERIVLQEKLEQATLRMARIESERVGDAVDDARRTTFELESVLIEHPAVAEAAVVPSPDPTRLAVPKAYVVLAEGWAADAETAQAIFAHSRAQLSPYQRIRRLEFADLPKTISGKIRRVELRSREGELHADPEAKPATEYTL